ncbi:hypothetical protein ACFV16_25220 [Streptomyces massasporeus]|uniref:hypothetical protein n=1 Tax=Streptomyces massasporeus TaxID=67324 RepID=UPI0036CE9CE4
MDPASAIAAPTPVTPGALGAASEITHTRRTGLAGAIGRCSLGQPQILANTDLIEGGFHLYDGKPPNVVTGMKLLQEHGPAATIFRRFSQPQNQTLLKAVGNPRREAHDARAAGGLCRVPSARAGDV